MERSGGRGIVRTVAAVAAAAVVASGLVGIDGGPAEAAQSWSAPQQVTAYGEGIRVATSADGLRAVAAYHERGGPSGVVLTVRTSTDAGGTWGAPVPLSTVGEESDDAHLAMAPDGSHVLVAWTQWNGVISRVNVRESADGGATWGPTGVLQRAGDPCHATDVHLAADGSRATVLATCTAGGVAVAVVSRSTDSGASWAPLTDLSGGGTSVAGPRLAGSTDGTRLTAAWATTAPAVVVETVQSTDSGASWTAPAAIAGTDAVVGDVRLAASADGGRVVAALTRTVGTVDATQVVVRAPGASGWTAPTSLSVDGAATSDPAIVVSGSGDRVTVAWLRQLGLQRQVQVRTSADGGVTWAGATDLTDGSAALDPPRLVASGDGRRLVAAWSAEVAGGEVLRARTSGDSGGTWTSAVDLSAASPSLSPSLASSTTGAVVVAGWDQSADVDYRLLASTLRIVPSVGALTPASGPATGGGQVTITGSDLSEVTGVAFGGTPATSFTVDSDSRITAVAPRHPAGTVDVDVTSAVGSARLAAAYTYVGAPPGAVGSLRAVRKKRGRVRVGWSPPSSDGGSAVTGYRVRISKANKKKYRAWRTVTVTKIRYSGLRPARYRLQVRAVNDVGRGPATTVRFRVRRS